MVSGVGLLLVSLRRIGAPVGASAGDASPPYTDQIDYWLDRTDKLRSTVALLFATGGVVKRLATACQSATATALQAVGYGKMRPQAVMAKLAQIQLGIAGRHQHQAEAFGETTRELVRSGQAAILEIAAVSGPPVAADALIKQALADPFHAAERFAQAARYYAPFAPGKASTAYADAIRRDARNPYTLIEIARLHKDAGNSREAGRCLEIAWELAPPIRAQGHVWGEFGDLFLAEADLAEAARFYEQALRIAQHLTGDDADELGRRVDLSIAHSRLGNLERVAGHPIDARAHFAANLGIALQLATHDPHSAEWQRDLAACHDRLAGFESECGDRDVARRHLEQALAIRLRLAKDAPHNPVWQRGLLKTHKALGDLEQRASNFVQARFHFERGLAIAQRLSQRNPRKVEWLRHLATSHERLGICQQRSGNPVQARAHFEQAATIRSSLAISDRRNPETQRDLARMHSLFGEFELSFGYHEQARRHFEAALGLIQRLSAAQPHNAARKRDLAIVTLQLGRCEPTEGHTEASRL